jgi:hypothetical protein
VTVQIGGDLTSVEWRALVELLAASAGKEDDARLTCGEVAALITTHRGDLLRACKESGQEYKTIAERRKTLLYYQQLSAEAEVKVGDSAARDLLAECPTLRWKHLVIAKGFKNPEWSMRILMRRGVHMTVPEFARHMSLLKKRLKGQWDGGEPIILRNDDGVSVRVEGYTGTRSVTLMGDGLRVTVERNEVHDGNGNGAANQ